MQTDLNDNTTNEQTQNEETVQNDPIDNPVDNTTVEQQGPDFRLLYQNAVQQYNQLNEKLERLTAQQQQAQNRNVEEPELTDEDLNRLGTVPTLKKLVATTLRQELGETLGDLREMNQQYKRGQMLSNAETQFFNQYPQLAAYREQLAPMTRQVLDQNRVDPSLYGQVALAQIGQLVAVNGFPTAPQNTPQNSNTPSRVSAPASAGRPPAPARNTAPRLSELERHGMRLAKMNPDDPAKVQEFLAMVNNNDGVTV